MGLKCFLNAGDYIQSLIFVQLHFLHGHVSDLNGNSQKSNTHCSLGNSNFFASTIDYYCRTRQTDKTPHSVLEKMKEAENFSYSMNFGHFSIQVGISPSEVISAQKMKWAVKL